MRVPSALSSIILLLLQICLKCSVRMNFCALAFDDDILIDVLEEQGVAVPRPNSDLDENQHVASSKYVSLL
jgi:hypothetical protein